MKGSIFPQKHFYKNVYSSFIHNIQETETTQMSMNRTDKSTMIYSYNSILLDNKKGGTVNTCNNMEQFLKHADQEKPNNGSKYHVIPFM